MTQKVSIGVCSGINFLKYVIHMDAEYALIYMEFFETCICHKRRLSMCDINDKTKYDK